MKEAYWGYGMITIFIFALFIFWYATRTTVYNQQDYLYMKSQVEAAMMDAIDWQAFKQGFYVCTNERANDQGLYTMKKASDYEVITCANNPKLCDANGNLLLISNNEIESKDISKKANCEAIIAEYKIIAGKSDQNGNILLDNCPNGDNVTAKDGFGCILKARLDSILKDGYNSKSFNYKLEVNKVVEYPPKVSVRLSYNQEIRNSLNNQQDSFDVVNDINAILEDDGSVYFYDEPRLVVKFDSDGGSEVPVQLVAEGELVKEPTKPTKNKLYFVEWQLNGKKYDFSKPLTKDIELKAVWSKTKLVDKITMKEVKKSYHNAAVKASGKTDSGLTPSYTYYSDSKCKTKTTTKNASSSGGAPKSAGTYYVIATTSPGKSSYYQPLKSSCLKAVTITESMCGDLNYDTVVNLKDAAVLANYLNGTTKLSYKDNIDLNLDGEIDTLDSIIINEMVAGNMKCPAKNFKLYGDVNQDFKVDKKDLTLMDKFLDGTKSISKEVRTFADVDLDGYVTYHDRKLISDKIAGKSVSLGSKSLQVKHMIPGDFNFDNKIDDSDCQEFSVFLSNNNSEMAPYIKPHFDLNNDSKVDDTDFKILMSWSEMDLILYDVNKLQKLKSLDNLYHTDDYKADDYVAIIEYATINGLQFETYHVLNIKRDLGDLKNMKAYAKKVNSYASKIDKKILKYMKDNGSTIVYISNFDCDMYYYTTELKGYYSAGNAMRSSRHIVMGYDLGRVTDAHYQRSIIHEFGHVFAFTTYYKMSGVGDYDISALTDKDLKNGYTSSDGKKLTADMLEPYFNNGFSWKTLAQKEVKNADKHGEEFVDSGGVFSVTPPENFIESPWEYFAECFRKYFISTNDRNTLKKYAPESYAGLEKALSYVK